MEPPQKSNFLISNNPVIYQSQNINTNYLERNISGGLSRL